MKVLLTGSTGQLGKALGNIKPKQVELVALNRKDLDLRDGNACRNAVYTIQPDWIFNCGAYTAVDKAEMQSDLAMSINAEAPRAFSEALLKTGGRLLQISTDFVFDGNQGFPYQPWQRRNPLGVYGKSKSAGEEAIEEILGETSQAIILRTSWLMGPVGNNFALRMLDLYNERDELFVVSDQVGSPTSTITLAEACWRIVEMGNSLAESKDGLPNILHWSDAGVASWYDISLAIGEIGLAVGRIDNLIDVNPIPSKNYPTPAKRPSYSVLDATRTRELLGLPSIHWRITLQKILETTPF